jgi:hypothetical protein
MAQVLCDVSEGLKQSEATVKLTSYYGQPEYIPVDRGLLSEDGGRHYLSVGLIYISRERNAALVALPVEADQGPTEFGSSWTNCEQKRRMCRHDPFRPRGARVEGKSSLARIGLGIHVTAPTIHPGFGEKVDDPDFSGSQICLAIWNIARARFDSEEACRSARSQREMASDGNAF